MFQCWRILVTNQNHILSFSQAFELAKTGVPVSSSLWDHVDRITSIDKVMQVQADQIWSPENRRIGALLKGPKGLIDVNPYSTKITRQGIINYIPTNEDLHAEWMRSDYVMRCVGISHSPEESDGYNLAFARTTPFEHIGANLPFWKLYDQEMIGYHHNAIFIAGGSKANIINSLIYNMLSSAIDNRFTQTMYDGFIDDDKLLEDEGWVDCCTPDVRDYFHIVMSEKDFDIDTHFLIVDKPLNVFIDIDSLNELNLVNGENALEYVRGQMMLLKQKFPLLNWVSFSLKEEMQGSRVEEDEESDAADDETYALKAD